MKFARHLTLCIVAQQQHAEWTRQVQKTHRYFSTATVMSQVCRCFPVARAADLVRAERQRTRHSSIWITQRHSHLYVWIQSSIYVVVGVPLLALTAAAAAAVTCGGVVQIAGLLVLSTRQGTTAVGALSAICSTPENS